METRDADRIVNSVGHELKTPLTPIKGFTELLKRDDIINDTFKRMYYLDLISKNADRLHSAILELQDSLRSQLYPGEVDKYEQESNGSG